MFAVKHTATIDGRIRLLVVFRITVNLINISGVPCGTSCYNVWFMFLIHQNGKNHVHNGSARVNVSVRCLFLVKVYGPSPRKLFIKIVRNNEVEMNMFPLFG
jgi:hypothetical protein